MDDRVIFIVAKLIPSLLGVGTTAILTRLLAPREYGLYAVGLTIVFFVTIGAFDWIGLSLLRMSPSVRDPDRFYGTIMACFGAVAAVAVTIGFASLFFLGWNDFGPLVFAALLAGLTSALTELQQRLQMTELRSKAYFVANITRGTATVLLVPGAAYAFGTAPTILAALGLANLVSAVAGWDPRLNLLRVRFDRVAFRNLLGYGLPLSIGVGLATILMSVDKWALQILASPDNVGLFTAAAVVTQMPVLMLASSVGPSAYSMAVRAAELGTPAEASAQLTRNFVLLFGMLMPSAFGIVAVAGNLAHVLVGRQYWSAVITLAPWLAGSAVVASLRAFYADIAFQLAQRTAPLMWTTLLALVVNCTLDIILVPIWQERAAAISSFSALCIALVVTAAAGRRVFRLPLPIGETIKILAGSGLMFLAVRAFHGLSGVVGLMVQIMIGLVVYAVCVLLLDIGHARNLLLPRGSRQTDKTESAHVGGDTSRDGDGPETALCGHAKTDIAVVIPTLNRSHLVMRALESVFAQTLPPREIIVVVDGPDEATLAALDGCCDPRLNVVRHARSRGAAAARTSGVLAARSEWIAFLDDDDTWLEEKLAKQAELARRGATFVTCLSNVLTPIARYVWPVEVYDNRQPVDAYLFHRRSAFAGQSFLQTSSYLLRRDLYLAAPFRPESPHDDWDFLIRVTAKTQTRIETVREPLVNVFMEEQRPSLSHATSWRASLAWAEDMLPLMSRRGYAGFCLGVVGPRAAQARAYSAFLPLLWRAIHFGAPSTYAILAYFGFWTIPVTVRRRLRAAISKSRAKPAISRHHLAPPASAAPALPEHVG